MMDVRLLHHPLPIVSWINTLVHHAARRDGMGHGHLLIKLERDIISGQTPSMELSLAPSTMSAGRAQRKRKT